MTGPGLLPADRQWHPKQAFPVASALLVSASVPLWLYVMVMQRTQSIQLFDPKSWAIIAATTAVLFGAFVWCEVVQLRVEIRSETVMFGVFEFPLVVGLMVLPWYYVLLAQFAGGITVFILRKDSLHHSAFNIAVMFVDSGVALAAIMGMSSVFNVTGIHTPSRPVEQAAHVAIAAGGVLVGSIISPLVAGVIYRRTGLSSKSPLAMVLQGTLVAGSVILFAAVEILLVTNSGIGVFAAVALMGAIIAVYLALRSVMSRHADLQQMYTFIRAVGDTLADTARWPQLMEIVREQNNASVAVIFLDNPIEYLEVAPGKLLALAVDSAGEIRIAPVGQEDVLLELARERGVVRASLDKDTDPVILAALSARNAKSVMLVALRASGRVRGYVEVRDPLSRWGEFTDEDSEFLSTLSVHMGTALENVQLLANLRNAAYRDSVTGLRSRAGLTVDAEEALAAGKLGGLALVHMDTLSQVNNALGHRHGEQLLVQAGRRIVESGPTDRAVARLESDLFAVLLPPGPESALAEQVAEILTAISPPYSLAGVDVEAEPRAGIAVVGIGPDDDHVDAVGLMQRAEMALLASRTRHERYEIFRPSMGDIYRRRFQLVTQFRAAVDQGHIVVHYQPKVTLQTQELRGVEALVRWVHPEFGVVTPGEFVKAIEATGSIDILLNHVLGIVLKQIRVWMDRNLEISVAVNLSVRNLTAKQFPQRVAVELEKHGVPARLLTFELTESNVMNDPETALPILDELHSMGISLSVDDFGTGYSSLAYLRRLPIDEIKIDRSFVLGMSTGLGDLAIVQSIIDLGHSLSLQVIAEGVEEDSSRALLTSMRCDGIQGFLLSRPQPADRLDAWLSARTVRSSQSGNRMQVLRVVG